MKKIYIQPKTHRFVASYPTAVMDPSGTHSIEPYKEAGTMYVGGDDGDVDGYETPNSLSPSAAKERMLWGDGEAAAPSSSDGLW